MPRARLTPLDNQGNPTDEGVVRFVNATNMTVRFMTDGTMVENQLDAETERILQEEEEIERRAAAAREASGEGYAQVTDQPVTPLQMNLAMRDQCGEVPNGEFVVQNRETGESYNFLIYTVTSSPAHLVGHRIIKFRRGSQYRGFAFLTMEGGIQLFRSHAFEGETEWVRAAEWLVNTAYHTNPTAEIFWYIGDFRNREFALGNSTNRCQRCNVVMTGRAYAARELCARCTEARQQEQAQERNRALLEAQETRRREAAAIFTQITEDALLSLSEGRGFKRMDSLKVVASRERDIIRCANGSGEVR